ncbi:MAG: threonylcarbamoyl-AMP synthase [Ignavibacteria bacterium GWB2_35_12]|nr:MAG: threonylcarbamoyl-AMP synthase [Ignavibacteria bacterium GWB2_35_12]OGU95871.1 MAG: threonylcarbamoyl-AMP synthase [Ignavibacteria bacterium RIFOXYA2_FULL_35_10]OGV20639.1 MAG: threonylcarbamoyl-AMP synthase [Ignavibacteria bacterium RIFOXYC2_FULL_35_21]
MTSEVLTIHSKTPELRKISEVAEALRKGAVILYPTDTGFTLGCELANKEAIGRIRAIRRLPEEKAMTFLCGSLSNLSEFAKVSNTAYRTIKRLIPGPYTFVLPASKQVPKFAWDPKRKTAGIRVPDHILSQLLLKELDGPIISISAKMPESVTINDPEELIKKFVPFVDVAVRSDSYNFLGESTVLDMTTDEFRLMRHGAGISKVLEYVDIENP